jgi:hypothetical protein
MVNQPGDTQKHTSPPPDRVGNVFVTYFANKAELETALADTGDIEEWVYQTGNYSFEGYWRHPLARHSTVRDGSLPPGVRGCESVPVRAYKTRSTYPIFRLYPKVPARFCACTAFAL